MSNPFGAIGHWFENLFKAIGGQLAVDTETFLKSFAVDDLGKLAVDAVTWVQAETSLKDADGVAKRDAAVAKLKTDALAAGKDIATFAESTLNFLIETALQAVVTGVAQV